MTVDSDQSTVTGSLREKSNTVPSLRFSAAGLIHVLREIRDDLRTLTREVHKLRDELARQR